MKTPRKTKTLRQPARRSPPLSLSARIERLEKAVLFPPTMASTAGRFTKLGSGGRPTSGDHVAVFDSRTGLTWSADPLLDGTNLNHADAMKACAALNLLGQKDWRAPTIEELLSIIDYSRTDPAVDPEAFKGPYGWTWSSTPAAAPAGCAWGVNLHNGDSFHDHQGLHGHVRAVRAGQPLGLVVSTSRASHGNWRTMKMAPTASSTS